MARNMCYDKTFNETRTTLMCEEIEKDDLTTALIGTLCNCIFEQSRTDRLFKRIEELEKQLKEK